MAVQPLRKRLGTAVGQEHNFVPSYLPVSSSSLTHHESLELRKEHGIEVSSSDCPPPVVAFDQLELSPSVVGYLTHKGYQLPTPVQMQVIPAILSGRDVVAYAETGSGKTLSFTLPLCRLLPLFTPSTSGEGPLALVLAPSRELAQQLHQYVRGFLSCLTPPPPALLQVTHGNPIPRGYSSVLLVGGVSMGQQVQALQQGVSVAVATPGKLLHLISIGSFQVNRLSYIVVDEVDRMLHSGMEEQMREVLMAITSSPRPKQVLLFSATMPTALERLARSAVLNPLVIQTGVRGLTAQNLVQEVLFLHSYQKQERLLEVLRSTERPPVLVFAKSISTVNEVTRLLHEEQFHVAGLHSEMDQTDRFTVMAAFKEERVDVLVATDLASRGLDIPGITRVVNYELPDNMEDYVHRCGRTARLQSPGVATSFLTLDCRIAVELKSLLESLEQHVPVELMNPQQFGKKVVRTELGDRVVEQ